MATKKWQIVVPADYQQTDNEYQIGGKKYVRVTTTLGVIGKPELISWVGRIGQRKADEIKTIRTTLGSNVHHLIEKNLKGEKYDITQYNAEVVEDLELFEIFKKKAELKPDALEQHLWSNEYQYAGTADYIGYYKSPLDYIIRGRKPVFTKKAYVLMDWKTARTIYDDYWLQMAAYIMAFEELTGIKLEGAVLVQLRYGKIKVYEKTYDELKLLFNVYKSVLVLYYWKYQKTVML